MEREIQAEFEGAAGRTGNLSELGERIVEALKEDYSWRVERLKEGHNSRWFDDVSSAKQDILSGRAELELRPPGMPSWRMSERRVNDLAEQRVARKNALEIYTLREDGKSAIRDVYKSEEKTPPAEYRERPLPQEGRDRDDRDPGGR